MKLRIRALLLAAMFVVSLLPAMSMAVSNVAKIGDTPYADLQTALDDAYAAGGEQTVTLLADVSEDVIIREKDNYKLTLDGANKKLTGMITLMGNSVTETNSATVIKDLTIDVVNIDPNASPVQAGIWVPGDSTHRYTQNVTVQNCKFTDSGNANQDVAAIRQSTGGCKDWTVIGCTSDETMHSLAQIKNVEQNLKFEDCTVNSKSGVNLNNTVEVELKDCEFNVVDHAVRIGEAGGGTTDPQVTMTGCTVKSSGTEDAAIIVRGAAAQAKVELTECTVEAENGKAIANTTNSDTVDVTVTDCEGIGEEDENGQWGTVEIVPPAYAGPVMNWVKVNTADNGVVKSGPLAASAGATVTLYPKAAAGYVLDTVEVLDAEGNAVELDGLKFAIPAGGVTVNATFKLAE